MDQKAIHYLKNNKIPIWSDQLSQIQNLPNQIGIIIWTKNKV